MHGVALQLREHALAAGELFAALEGSRPDLRALRPPPPPEPEMPEGWTGNKLSNDYLNFGPNMPPQTHLDRGTIEGVLSHLASLTQQFEERRALVPASEGMGADSFAVGPEHGEAAKNFLTDAEGSMAADEAKETAEGVA